MWKRPNSPGRYLSAISSQDFSSLRSAQPASSLSLGRDEIESRSASSAGQKALAEGLVDGDETTAGVASRFAALTKNIDGARARALLPVSSRHFDTRLRRSEKKKRKKKITLLKQKFTGSRASSSRDPPPGSSRRSTFEQGADASSRIPLNSCLYIYFIFRFPGECSTEMR